MYIPFILIITNFIILIRGLFVMMPLYMTRVFMVEASWAATLVGIASFSGVLGVLISGFLSDLFGRFRILLITMFSTVVSSLLISFAPYGALFVTGLFLLPFSSAASFPVLTALVADKTSPSERATVLGVIISASNLLAFLAPGLIGHLADNYGFKTSFLYPIGVTIIGCLASIHLRKRI